MKLLKPNLILILAYNRGYMKYCYHKSCDNFNRENVTNMNYKFLTTITEAVALTVMELSASGRVSKTALGGCEFSLDAGRIDDHVYKNTNEEDNEVEENSYQTTSSALKDKNNKNTKIEKDDRDPTFASNSDNVSNQKLGDEEQEKANEIFDSKNMSKEADSTSNFKTHWPIYSSGGGTQVNIGNINIALSLPNGNLNTPQPSSVNNEIQNYANLIPGLFKEPTYTNIIDYLVKKIYTSNEYHYTKKEESDVNTSVPRSRYKEEGRNNIRKKKNSPMIVHILDEADDMYSVFNEISGN